MGRRLASLAAQSLANHAGRASARRVDITTATPLASPGRQARRLLGRGAGGRAAVLCAADALDPCRRQSGDGSRLRSHPALDLLKAAALDRVLAVHRLPALSGSDPV